MKGRNTKRGCRFNPANWYEILTGADNGSAIIAIEKNVFPSRNPTRGRTFFCGGHLDLTQSRRESDEKNLGAQFVGECADLRFTLKPAFQ